MKVMRSWCLSLALTQIFTLGCGQRGLGQYSAPLKGQCDKLAHEVQAGRIGKVEILQIRLDTSFLVAVTPEVLEQLWDYKFTIHRLDGQRLDKTVDALKAAAPREATNGDLRWAIIFYSSDDKRVEALYFDRWGRKGALNGLPVSFGGNFFSQLKDALSPSLE